MRNHGTPLSVCNFDAPISVSSSGRRGKVTVWIPMIQRLSLAFKLRPERLPIRTWGCLTLMALLDCSWCSAEMKNKHTDTLN